MELMIPPFFFHQWQRKVVALLTAIMVWLFVSQSITSTKVISSVPIRLVNLPADQTVLGLLPNGFLAKRTTLTLTGTKDVIEQIEPGDIELLIDVSTLPTDGLVQITKKNLSSLNPGVNLSKHITAINHPEFVIRMSPLVTEKIPITIHVLSAPPPGYEFLDIWPLQLTQTVSGPQEQVLDLKTQGLELKLDLSLLSKETLNATKTAENYGDEIDFLVPEQWKKIQIPLLAKGLESINDPRADLLRINFLKKQFLPLKNEIPIQVFYPLKYSSELNPAAYPLQQNQTVIVTNHLFTLKTTLFASSVSKLFLDIVQDYLQIQLVAAPPKLKDALDWEISLVDALHLEDTYAAYLLSRLTEQERVDSAQVQELEKLLRNRFQYYKQNLCLYVSPESKLQIWASFEDNTIKAALGSVQKPLN